MKTNADKLKEEFYRGMAELKERQEETYKQIRELKESQKKTDEQLKKTDEGINKLRESQKKTDEQLKKTDEQLKKLSKEVGKVTDSIGRTAEGLASPSMPNLLNTVGIKTYSIYENISRRKDGENIELDVLSLGKLKNGEEIVIIGEVKNTLTIKVIDEFIRKKIDRFSQFFEEYKGRGIVGVIGGMKIFKEAKEYGEKKGLYILSPKNDIMVFLNRAEFKPKIWK